MIHHIGHIKVDSTQVIVKMVRWRRSRCFVYVLLELLDWLYHACLVLHDEFFWICWQQRLPVLEIGLELERFVVDFDRLIHFDGVHGFILSRALCLTEVHSCCGPSVYSFFVAILAWCLGFGFVCCLPGRCAACLLDILICKVVHVMLAQTLQLWVVNVDVLVVACPPGMCRCVLSFLNLATLLMLLLILESLELPLQIVHRFLLQAYELLLVFSGTRSRSLMWHSRYEVGVQIHSHLVDVAFMIAPFANMADYELFIWIFFISSCLLVLQILFLLFNDVIIY